MKKSDDEQVSQKSGFLDNLEIVGPKNDQNPAFFEGIRDRNNAENLQVSGTPYNPPIFGSDQDLMDSWIGLKKSIHTQRAYQKVGEDFLHFIHPKTLKEVSLPILQNFLGLYQYKSHETQRQKIAVIQSLFSFAVKMDYLPKNPAVLLPSLKAHSKISNRRLTEEEVFRMIDRTHNDRDNAILRVLYNGGLRRSELVSLNWGDVFVTEKGEGLISVMGKGDTKETVGLNATTTTQLLKLKPPKAMDHDPLLLSREGRRVSVGTVLLVIKKAAIRAGISKKVSPHWLRNAHATHARARGAPLELVQETLRHKDITTTRRYVNANPEDFSGRYLGI